MAASKAELSAKIDDVFLKVTSTSGTGDLVSVAKVFWPVLDNKISLVDLAGVYTMSVSGHGSEVLDLITFGDFFNGIARVKYSSGSNFAEKLLDDLSNANGVKLRTDLPIFGHVFEKNVIRMLLKYDLSLRRAFSGFA